jgi:sulfate transport system ATP-binding protein
MHFSVKLTIIKDRVNELIRLVGLEGLGKRRPRQLSGGKRQRVAFARALAPNPHLLLLDEPFAAIDAKVRKELRTWLRDISNKFIAIRNKMAETASKFAFIAK